MDYKDLTALLVKLVGAVLLFWYITWLPSLIPAALEEKSFWASLLINFLPALIPIGLALVIFMFPATVTNKFVKGDKLNTDRAFLKSIEILALRLVGVFYIFRSVVDLVSHLTKVWITPHLYEKAGVTPPPTAWSPQIAADVIATSAELAFAIWLAFGAVGIINMIHRVRGRGEF